MTPPWTTECIGCRRCNSSPLNRASVRGTGHEKRPLSALSSSCLYCSRAILESEDSSVSSETLIEGSTRWHWNAGKRRRLNPSSNPGSLVVASSIEPQRTAEDHDLYSASSSLPSSLPRASPGPNVEHPCSGLVIPTTSWDHHLIFRLGDSTVATHGSLPRLLLPPQLNAVDVPRTR